MAWAYYIGLICLIYISNTLSQTQGGSSMKTWDWINIRRTLEDAMNNAFKETIMKNMPINQFQSFKWRKGVRNWNLREKLSKIGHVENFDFWSKVNAESQSQLVQGQSQRILVRVGSRFSGRVTGRAVDPLTSSYDVSLTWTRADVDMLAWLLTWIDDVIRWRQMTSTADFGAWKERACSPARGSCVML